MAKRYDQYCPIAHALELVGERWALLVVRELVHGPLRYTDLLERVGGCSTNILAARLRDLERGAVVTKRRLDPPAASTVYELTALGEALRPVLHELAHWGMLSLGPPTADMSFPPGWLPHALDTAAATVAPAGRYVFEVAGEVASLRDGEALPGAVEDADVTVTTDPPGLYRLLVEGMIEDDSFDGDRDALERLVDAVSPVRRGRQLVA